MNYYKVAAKCGHVRKGHYIIKDFYVKAEDGKNAAYIVRYLPRVKHDWKYAIISVEPITRDEFIQGLELHKSDSYFNVTNSSDQRLYGAVDFEQIMDFDEPITKKKKKDRDSMFYNKMARIQQIELKMQLAEVV